jgi:hypothetical protein
MRKRTGLLPAAALALSACVTTGDVTPATEPGFLAQVPEAVAAAAAPGQSLQSVALREEDGCYWYRHSGPVETTLLPLRTREGRVICTRPQIGALAVR